MNIFYKIIKTKYLLLFFFLVFAGCEKEKKSNENILLINPNSLKQDFSDYDVCSCNKEAEFILDQSIIVRNQHKDFTSFKEDKNSVSSIRSWAKRWTSLMKDCFRKNGSTMWMSSDCNNQVLIQKKKEILFNLGIQIDQGERVKL